MNTGFERWWQDNHLELYGDTGYKEIARKAWQAGQNQQAQDTDELLCGVPTRRDRNGSCTREQDQQADD